MRPDESLSDDQQDGFDYRDSNEDSSDAGADSSVLEDAIRNTLAGDTRRELRPEELESLLQVARRHRGIPFALEPVAIDLIDALLTVRFTKDGFKPDMAREIATSLFDAPVSNERLESLWQRLKEATE